MIGWYWVLWPFPIAALWFFLAKITNDPEFMRRWRQKDEP